MVLPGACVFTTMTACQVTFAASRGLSPSVFCPCQAAGAIVPRFIMTGVLARRGLAAATVLQAGMWRSLAGFPLTGRYPVRHAASSALLGVICGLCYPLIQARAGGSAPGGLRYWALRQFSLAYLAGIYGFPLIAGTVTALGGYQSLIACLLVIAAAELAVSIRPAAAERQATRPRAAERPAIRPGQYHLTTSPASAVNNRRKPCVS